VFEDETNDLRIPN